MSLRYKTSYILILSSLFALILSSCIKEEDFTTNDINLSFSRDTIFFDTVFTELGSATRILKVYNNKKENIRINRIRVANSSESFFRLNVDGISGNDLRDVDIAAEDSLYIFAEVTIDPDNPLSVSPFVIDDKIIFETDGNEQEVALEAWGQNANYFPSRLSGGNIALLSCDFGEFVFDDEKPYVIYGILVVDSCTLVIPEGKQIYIHGGLVRGENADGTSFSYNDGQIWVSNQGKIRTEGTAENPVVFQGDRLEESFDDIPGQWYGLLFTGGSRENSLQYTTVKNALFGVAVDSACQVNMQNCQIFNTSSNGIIGIHSEIQADNCLIYNNSASGVNLLYGGNYQFRYCTMASYGVDASALSLSNGLCLDQFCTEFRTNPLEASFTNCIVYGSRLDEVDLSDFTETPGDLNYSFDHCIVRVTDLLEEDAYPDFFDFCSPCLNPDPQEPLFKNAQGDDYQLDSLSVAEGMALPIDISIDLENKMRDANNPDIGCYEKE